MYISDVIGEHRATKNDDERISTSRKFCLISDLKFLIGNDAKNIHIVASIDMLWHTDRERIAAQLRNNLSPDTTGCNETVARHVRTRKRNKPGLTEGAL